jgi:hypothetical protein
MSEIAGEPAVADVTMNVKARLRGDGTLRTVDITGKCQDS